MCPPVKLQRFRQHLAVVLVCMACQHQCFATGATGWMPLQSWFCLLLHTQHHVTPAGSWLPGWSPYLSACNRLNDIIANILQQTRAEQQQSSTLPAQHHSTTSARGGISSSSSSSRPTLLSFLLAAQQQQGSDVITDQDICDEIKTILFGGTDTSAFTLAMCAYYLALHPEAADRGAAEVSGLLQQTGRSSVSQMTAADASKLPWVQACVNETMRLAPAGPVITRTANQVRHLM